jgi:hypothetical protein
LELLNWMLLCRWESWLVLSLLLELLWVPWALDGISKGALHLQLAFAMREAATISKSADLPIHVRIAQRCFIELWCWS